MRRVYEIFFIGVVLFFVMGCGEIEKPKSPAELEAYQLDVLFAQADAGELCLVVAGIQFGCRPVDSANNLSVAMDDLNGDGVLDAVFGTENAPNTICLGGQLGGLSCMNLNETVTTTVGVAMGDVNGDKHLDLVMANESQNHVCINNGEATFECRALSDLSANSRSVALGDLNADGNLDVVFANVGANHVCINNGAGAFSCRDVNEATHNNTSVALGDLDGDTVLDIVFMSVDQPNQACISNGAGRFNCRNLSEGPGKSNAVTLGNFIEENRGEDEAPILDMVIAATDGYYVCTGDGQGGIASCNETINNVNTTGMTSGYLNGDDHLDVVFVRSSGPSRICVGDGAGKLRCRTHNFQNASGASGAVMGRFAPYLGSESD